MFKLFLLDSLRVMAIGMVVIYLTLVVMALRVEGTNLSLRVDRKNPLASLERLLIWTGVKLATMTGRFFQGAFNELVKASAELGEWIVGLAGHDAQARFRSHYL